MTEGGAVDSFFAYVSAYGCATGKPCETCSEACPVYVAAVEIFSGGGVADELEVIVEAVPNSYGHIVYNGTTLLVM